jgi:GTP:adenosylcobinamide-phosphate guanylyltransferase
MATGAELTYQTSASALQMANAIFGDGVTVTGASYSGANNSSAIYSNGQLAAGVLPSDSGVILSTGNASDFTQSRGDPNRSSSTSTNTSGINNDSQLNAIAGARTYDASILTVDFVPTGNVMTMQFIISSEEYPEFVGSSYNDIIGVWINGVHVPISVGNGNTGVNNINAQTQPNLMIDNTSDQYNTEMDGFTVTLSLDIPVIAGQTNSIRIGVADTSDTNYDTNLLIAADSVQTVLVAQDDAVTMTPQEYETIDVLANDSHSGGTLTITKINGQSVTAGQTIILPSGQSVLLNADGTFTLHGNGDTETVAFTYTVEDGLGHTDTAQVTLNSIPCFVAGTQISTPEGDRAVEDLQEGDLIDTLDAGPQPLRWSGSRTVAAEGNLAPISIKAGTFGNHGTLMVSPQHRVLVRDVLAELLFGQSEVLVAAKDLVNDKSVRQIEGGEVCYVHLLFDEHQIVFSDGLATESFLPGPQTTRLFERPIVEEICAIFPEIDPESGEGYGPAARRTLAKHEATVLFNAGRRCA